MDRHPIMAPLTATGFREVRLQRVCDLGDRRDTVVDVAVTGEADTICMVPPCVDVEATALPGEVDMGLVEDEVVPDLRPLQGVGIWVVA